MDNKVVPGDYPPGYDQHPPAGYAQPGYAQPYPPPPGLAQPAPNVVVVSQQGREPRTDFTMPAAKVPGILMLVAAVVNLAVFFAIGMLAGFQAEFVVGFILYLVLAILGMVGGFQKQRTSGVAVGCIIMAVVCLFMAFSQMINRGIGVLAAQILIAFGVKEIGSILLWCSVILLVVALMSFVLSIVLIVLPSRVVCDCCGGGATRQGGVIITGAGVAQTTTTVTHIA